MPGRRRKSRRMYDSMESDNLLTPTESPSEYPSVKIPPRVSAKIDEEEPETPPRRPRKHRGRRRSYTPRAQTPRRQRRSRRGTPSAPASMDTPMSPLFNKNDIDNFAQGDFHEIEFGRKAQKLVGSAIRKSARAISKNPTAAGALAAGALIGTAALMKHGKGGVRKAVNVVTGNDKAEEKAFRIASKLLDQYKKIKAAWFFSPDRLILEPINDKHELTFALIRTYILSLAVEAYRKKMKIRDLTLQKLEFNIAPVFQETYLVYPAEDEPENYLTAAINSYPNIQKEIKDIIDDFVVTLSQKNADIITQILNYPSNK